MQQWNRRWFLATLAATCAAEPHGKGRTFPSVAVRYPDPATEFTVLRLTDPQFSSSLPLAGNRGVTARSLLYASDMAGDWQAYRMDLKNKESRQLTEAGHLDPASIALLPKDRGFWHFDGPTLVETAFAGLKSRDVYHVPDVTSADGYGRDVGGIPYRASRSAVAPAPRFSRVSQYRPAVHD